MTELLLGLAIGLILGFIGGAWLSHLSDVDRVKRRVFALGEKAYRLTEINPEAE